MIIIHAKNAFKINNFSFKMKFFTLLLICFFGINYAHFLIPKPLEINTGIQNLTISRCLLNFKQESSYYSEGIQKILDTHKKIFLQKNECLLDDSRKNYEIQIKVNNIENSENCQDESYELFINLQETKIISNCTVGIIRAISTLYQLSKISKNTNEITIESIPIHIKDSPRFQHRGVLIDTSRHYMSKAVLSRIIDGMMLGKLNVLHWHITDDDSFPFDSQTFPGLAQASAHKPNLIYTPQDIQYLVEYAKIRGVRIIPELDNPGHIRSVGLYKDFQEMFTCFNKSLPYNVPGAYKINGGPPPAALDPTLNKTYDFIKGILSDASKYFSDEYIHLGGDEVMRNCWDEHPDIKEFMKKNNILDYAALFVYYIKRVREMMSEIDPKRKVIYWTAENEFKYKYPIGDVLQYWGHSKNIDKMKDLYPMNKFIFSPYDFLYLDCGYENPYGWNAWCGDFKTWTKMYNFEPTNYSIPESKILGAEACAWAELINEDNIENKLWPRVVALAAILWEPRRNKDADLVNLVKSLTEFNKKLNQIGIRTSPITGHYCELNSHECFQKWDEFP